MPVAPGYPPFHSFMGFDLARFSSNAFLSAVGALANRDDGLFDDPTYPDYAREILDHAEEHGKISHGQATKLAYNMMDDGTLSSTKGTCTIDEVLLGLVDAGHLKMSREPMELAPRIDEKVFRKT